MTDGTRKRTGRKATRPKRNNQAGGSKPLAGCGAQRQSSDAARINQMRKNTYSVFQAFINRSRKSGDSISTDGERIYSYRTVLAVRTADGIALNSRKYSNTTSRQQSDIRALAAQNGMTVTPTDGEPNN